MNELPLSLSIVTAEKMTVKMLERGTALPASKTRIFTTRKPLPNAVMIELVMGETLRLDGTKRLTRIRLGGIRKTVGDVARIAVKLSVSEEGIIEMEAFDYGSHHKKTRRIGSAWLPETEAVEKAVEHAKETEEEETILRERCRLVSRAHAVTLTLSSMKKADRAQIPAEQWSEIRAQAKDLKKRTAKARPEKLTEIDAKVITEEVNKLSAVIEDIRNQNQA